MQEIQAPIKTSFREFFATNFFKVSIFLQFKSISSETIRPITLNFQFCDHHTKQESITKIFLTTSRRTHTLKCGGSSSNSSTFVYLLKSVIMHGFAHRRAAKVIIPPCLMNHLPFPPSLHWHCYCIHQINRDAWAFSVLQKFVLYTLKKLCNKSFCNNDNKTGRGGL